ncbi:hypothetical protein G9A89_011660 [Geosiphon pyriformis]|nr:hypothetical protein G9A89_011660 [Geosiphon pyriformis]
MSSLAQQAAAFKQQVKSQPVYARPRIATPSSSSPTNLAGGQNVPRIKVEEVGAGSAGTVSISKKSKKPGKGFLPPETGVGKHTLSQLHNVINFLKASKILARSPCATLYLDDTPQTAEDLKREQVVDVNANRDLYKLMINNEKIQYDPVNRSFQYKPEFLIRGNEDLLDLLKARREEKPCGMHFKDLADSYVDVTSSIKELEEQGQILVIRMMKDHSPRLMFWNDPAENTPMDKDFVEMFHKVKIPDEVDLSRALKDAGLQTMAVLENKSRIESKQKQRKRKQVNRRVKLTNTHLDHLDLTKDYTPNKS